MISMKKFQEFLEEEILATDQYKKHLLKKDEFDDALKHHHNLALYKFIKEEVITGDIYRTPSQLQKLGRWKGK